MDCVWLVGFCNFSGCWKCGLDWKRTFFVCGRNEVCVENENVLENGILVGVFVQLDKVFFVVVGDTIFAYSN